MLHITTTIDTIITKEESMQYVTKSDHSDQAVRFFLITAIYFSISSFSCTRVIKSANRYRLSSRELIYRKYFPIIIK